MQVLLTKVTVKKLSISKDLQRLSLCYMSIMNSTFPLVLFFWGSMKSDALYFDIDKRVKTTGTTIKPSGSRF